MGNEIVKLDGAMSTVDQIIGSVFDAKSAHSAVGNMAKIKKILEVAEQYGQYANRFCGKEAELYITIAGIDGAESELTKAQRELVAWIRSKSKDEITAILEECASGRRINNIRNSELRANSEILKSKNVESEYNRISSIILHEYSSMGRTTVSPQRFFEEWLLPTAPDKAAAKAYTEKTRDELIHRGGVGIADGVGTYVDPSTGNRKELAQAVSARLRSIYADMESLTSLCKHARFSIPSEGVYELKRLLDEMEEVCR